MRIGIIRITIIGFFVFILSALIYMQVIRGNYYFDQSSSNRIRIIPIDAPRGEITDNKGVVLADNRLAYHAAIIEQEMYDKTALFAFLGSILNKDPNVLIKYYDQHKINPFSPVLVAEDIPREIVFKIEENRFLFPGLIVLQGYQRRYPLGSATAHAVGYVGKIDAEQIAEDAYGYTPLSYTGKNGIEKSYDEILRGSSGGNQIEVNARGQQVRILSIKQPEGGKNIALSIDAELSRFVTDAFNQRRGAAVFMDLSDGRIPVLVSSPSFNSNAFVDRSINNQVSGFFQDTNAPFLNRVSTGKFAPGSVFKIPVALAALQLEKITPSVTYDCPGFMMLGARRFGCAHVHGREDLLQAIAHSCNVYFFHLGQLLGSKTINAYAKAFGFNRVTGIDLPFESSGHLRADKMRRDWYGGDILNLSIGQGETLTTPIQVAVMMGAVATNGFLIKPQLIKSIDGEIVETEDIKKRPRVRLRPEVWDIVKEGMRQVVTDDEGTGRALKDLSGMTIWGKTGTAQTGVGKENHAWFAGFVRGPEHAYAFCIFLEHGGSSANAVILTKDILLQMQKLKLI